MHLELLKTLKSNWKDRPVFVFGDLGLDRYITSTVKGVSEDAPALVTDFVSDEDVPSMAGLVSAHVAGIGGTVFSIGVTGEDQARLDLEGSLAEHKVRVDLLLSHNMRHTATFTKFMVGDRLLYQINRETVDMISPAFEEYIEKVVRTNVELMQPACAVIIDRGKGVVTSRLIDTFNKVMVPVIIDPHPGVSYEGAWMLTPTLEEARAMSGCGNAPDSARAIVNKYKLTGGCVVNCGANGAWYSTGREEFHIPGTGKINREAFVAVLAMCLPEVGMEVALEAAVFLASFDGRGIISVNNLGV